LSPQLQVEAALDDAKEILSLGILVRDDTSIKPPDGSFHGLFHTGVVRRRSLDDIVKLHHDI
jgi:hypothetical protein